MKISYNWIREITGIALPPQELADLITRAGLEVEELVPFETIRGGLRGLYIGEVLTVVKHPDADKLKLTTVSIGKDPLLHIVCGAPNVEAGQKVVVAVEGTELFPFSGEPFRIKKSKIRGVASEGMLCAEDEIGLGESHAGLLLLPPDAPVGQDVATYMKVESDTILEIGLTANRGDAFSHFGVARDVLAALQAHADAYQGLKIPDTLNWPIVAKPNAGPGDHSPITLEIQNPSDCLRYAGLCLEGIQVGESPAWLKQRLQSLGLKPINNIVDVTNLVLQECGQPLHAFNLDAIAGQKIVVGNVPEGTPFLTLDEREIKLHEFDLCISDAQGPMCLAGVYGGSRSGVKADTRAVFLESACFLPTAIRRTATAHQLRTEAAQHFEKGTDIGMIHYALFRAAQLILELAGGRISSPLLEEYPQPVSLPLVRLSFDKLNRMAGTTLPPAVSRSILLSLGFTIQEETALGIQWQVPSWKRDMERPEDLAEEVLRLYGYDHIPLPTGIHSSLSHAPSKDPELLLSHLSASLAAMGFREMMNNSITNSAYHDRWKETGLEQVKLLSYGNAGLDALRSSMLYGGLEVIARNLHHKQHQLRLFEFGRTYFKKGEQYQEERWLSLFICGPWQDQQWNAAAQGSDFYHLKAMVDRIFEYSGSSAPVAEPVQQTVHFSDGATLRVGHKTMGRMGQIHPSLLRDFDIKPAVWYAEISQEALFDLHRQHTIRFKEWGRFPAVSRDLALVLEESVSFESIRKISKKVCGSLLQDVSLFDVYQDARLGEGKKSYAIRFILQDTGRTLTDAEIEQVMDKLSVRLKEECGATVRQ